MSLKLVRLDDRLIHGQVVVGWGNAVAADRILLIDDEVAANDWERELYAMGVPPEMEVEFAAVDDCAAALERSANSKQRTIVLVGDVDTLVRVARASDVVKRVNIGGVHEGDGRVKRLAYVFLTEEEAQALKSLEDNGQIVFRYCDRAGNVTQEANPNGSVANIAGIMNRAGNVLGLMPHPERAAEAILGSDDGRLLLASAIETLGNRSG